MADENRASASASGACVTPGNSQNWRVLEGKEEAEVGPHCCYCTLVYEELC